MVFGGTGSVEGSAGWYLAVLDLWPPKQAVFRVVFRRNQFFRMHIQKAIIKRFTRLVSISPNVVSINLTYRGTFLVHPVCVRFLLTPCNSIVTRSSQVII